MTMSKSTGKLHGLALMKFMIRSGSGHETVNSFGKAREDQDSGALSILFFFVENPLIPRTLFSA